MYMGSNDLFFRKDPFHPYFFLMSVRANKANSSYPVACSGSSKAAGADDSLTGPQLAQERLNQAFP